MYFLRPFLLYQVALQDEEFGEVMLLVELLKFRTYSSFVG